MVSSSLPLAELCYCNGTVLPGDQEGVSPCGNRIITHPWPLPSLGYRRWKGVLLCCPIWKHGQIVHYTRVMTWLTKMQGTRSVSVLDAQLEEQPWVERLVSNLAISMSSKGCFGDSFWRKPGSSLG